MFYKTRVLKTFTKFAGIFLRVLWNLMEHIFTAPLVAAPASYLSFRFLVNVPISYLWNQQNPKAFCCFEEVQPGKIG